MKESTRRCLSLLKEIGWLKSPYSGMELDRLEFQFNEDTYILHPDCYEVEE